MAERKTFGPVLLLGLAAGTLTAVAGNRVWAEPDTTDLAWNFTGLDDTAAQVPLATSLSLVVLAAWGVVLVTRGRVRRTVTWLGLAASVGVLATVVAAWFRLPDTVRDDVAELGSGDVDVSFTGWYWAAAVGAVLSLVATGLAVRHVAAWPEMGSRYDAPGAAPAAEREPESNLELWKALDDGRDPTDRPSDGSPDPSP